MLIPVVVGLVIAEYSFGRHGGDTSQVVPTLPLRQAVVSILDSEDFLTALRSTLPKGESDPQYGLDYIPYMLDSIDQRRRRFQRSSMMFLAATIALGFVFSGIVVYFGYILVNESAAGFPRTMSQIEGSLREIRRDIQITPNPFNSETFASLTGDQIRALREYIPPATDKPQHDAVQSAIQRGLETGNVGANSLLRFATSTREQKVRI